MYAAVLARPDLRLARFKSKKTTRCEVKKRIRFRLNKRTQFPFKRVADREFFNNNLLVLARPDRRARALRRARFKPKKRQI